MNTSVILERIIKENLSSITFDLPQEVIENDFKAYIEEITTQKVLAVSLFVEPSEEEGISNTGVTVLFEEPLKESPAHLNWNDSYELFEVLTSQVYKELYIYADNESEQIKGIIPLRRDNSSFIYGSIKDLLLKTLC